MDISTEDMAGVVHKALNKNWYQVMLTALQNESARFDYTFSNDAHMKMPAALPKVVEESLARAVLLARESHLTPLLDNESIERMVKKDFNSGYAQQFLGEILGCLRDRGIVLQPGATSKELVRREELRATGLLLRYASNLASAIQLHINLEASNMGSAEKLVLKKNFLDLSGFDASPQLVIFLSQYSHDGFSGPCPDIVSLLEPMIDLSIYEMDAIVDLAKEKLAQ